MNKIKNRNTFNKLGTIIKIYNKIRLMYGLIMGLIKTNKNVLYI